MVPSSGKRRIISLLRERSFFYDASFGGGEHSVIKLSAPADKRGTRWEGERRETTLFLLPCYFLLFFSLSKEGSNVSWSSAAGSALSRPLERKPLAIFCRTRELGTGWYRLTDFTLLSRRSADFMTVYLPRCSVDYAKKNALRWRVAGISTTLRSRWRNFFYIYNPKIDKNYLAHK